MADKPDLPKEVAELREVVGENITDLMTTKKLKDRDIEKLGVPRNSINRARRGAGGATLDTLALIAKALNVQPALLLMRGGAKHVSEVFTPPFPESEMGAGWTRRPLLEGKGNGRPIGEIPIARKKIKGRA
jgi:transcriptional regulator with XRE-family HTH domain